MEKYLDYVVSGLKMCDVKTLAILQKLEATVSFKSVTKNFLMKESDLSKFQLENTLDRLEATKFISIVKEGRSHKVCLTEYGELALNKNVGGDE